MTNIKVFISYKRVNKLPPPLAGQMKAHLEQHYGMDVFLDVEKIPSASEWAKVVIENIRLSDVLIVLIGEETASSDWVQREVDIARGANIAILPLVISEKMTAEEFSESLRRLALEDIQYVRFLGTDEEYSRLHDDILRLTKATVDNQRLWQESIEKRRRIKEFEEVNPSFRRYRLKNSNIACTLNVATGDMTRMRGIDVIVNSENNYMQMARFFQYNSISSSIRYKGAHIVEGNVWDDSVQRQLDIQVTASREIGFRPVNVTQVIVTTSGHEKSVLARQGIRYIFHIASVTVDIGTEKLVPLTGNGISLAIENCLRKVVEVNERAGVTSYDTEIGEQQRSNVESYTPIKSIIFSIIGTGSGGKSINEVMPHLLLGIKRFLLDHQEDPHMTLERIHLAVFSQSDLPYVLSSIEALFEPYD